METPLGGLVVPELVVPTGPWHLVGFQFDVTHGGNFFPGVAGGESLAVVQVGLYEGGDAVVVGGGRGPVRVLVEL